MRQAPTDLTSPTARRAGWRVHRLGEAALASPWALLLLLVYPAQVLRLSGRQGGFTLVFYLVLARFAEFLGVLKFVAARSRRAPARIIEYK